MSQGRRQMTKGIAARSSLVEIETRNRVAIVRMTAHSNRNALSVPVRTALLEAIRSVESSDQFGGLVLAGSDQAFSGGGDLRSMGPMTREEGEARIVAAQALPRAIHGCAKPVVAAVEGICAGAGLSLAAACDLIVAAKGAQFITSFEKVGLMPDLGASYSISARIGSQAARRLFLLGGALSAEQAQEAGLSDFLVERGDAESTGTELVGRLMRLAPGTCRAVRNVFRKPPATLEEAFRFEVAFQPDLYASADLQEGIAAFLEKRPPIWRDD